MGNKTMAKRRRPLHTLFPDRTPIEIKAKESPVEDAKSGDSSSTAFSGITEHKEDGVGAVETIGSPHLRYNLKARLNRSPTPEIRPDYYRWRSPLTGLPSLYWLCIHLSEAENGYSRETARYRMRANGRYVPRFGRDTMNQLLDRNGFGNASIKHFITRWEQAHMLNDPSRLPMPSREGLMTIAHLLQIIEHNPLYYLRVDPATGKEFYAPEYEEKYKGRGIVTPEGLDFVFHDRDGRTAWDQLSSHHNSFVAPVETFFPHWFTASPDDLGERVQSWDATSKLKATTFEFMFNNGADTNSAALAIVKTAIAFDKRVDKQDLHPRLRSMIEAIINGGKLSSDKDLLPIFIRGIDPNHPDVIDIEGWLRSMEFKIQPSEAIVVPPKK
jgi:hypothetical protein